VQKSAATNRASAAVTVQEVPDEQAGLGRGGDSPERTMKVGVVSALHRTILIDLGHH
jgi:hypothetical protein